METHAETRSLIQHDSAWTWFFKLFVLGSPYSHSMLLCDDNNIIFYLFWQCREYVFQKVPFWALADILRSTAMILGTWKEYSDRISISIEFGWHPHPHFVTYLFEKSLKNGRGILQKRFMVINHFIYQSVANIMQIYDTYCFRLSLEWVLYKVECYLDVDILRLVLN